MRGNTLCVRNMYIYACTEAFQQQLFVFSLRWAIDQQWNALLPTPLSLVNAFSLSLSSITFPFQNFRIPFIQRREQLKQNKLQTVFYLFLRLCLSLFLCFYFPIPLSVPFSQKTHKFSTKFSTRWTPTPLPEKCKQFCSNSNNRNNFF